MEVYFDNAATTPIDPLVIEAMQPYLNESFGNPSSIHTFGRNAKSAVEKARKQIAEILNVSPSEIYFTSGGTEGDNTAIIGNILSNGIKRAITSELEHHAVLHSLEFLRKTNNLEIQFVETDTNGQINYDHLDHLLKNNEKAMVTLMHGNNEIGNITDIVKVGDIAKQHDAIFHSDTVQTIGHYKLNVENTYINSFVGSSHKFHGPKGVGFVYISGEHHVMPLIHGGAQERNIRGGTENVASIVGMAKALELSYQSISEDETHIKSLKKEMIERLKSTINGVSFNGHSDDLEKSMYSILSVALPPSEENDMLLFKLDIEKIYVSGGSACTSGSNVGSHVLDALGIHPDIGAVRFSFSRKNTLEEVEYVANKLSTIYR